MKNWGVFCGISPIDGAIVWAEYESLGGGELRLTGQRDFSKVSPVEDPILIGDYNTCQDWAQCHGDVLKEAIARRHPLSRYDLILGDDLM